MDERLENATDEEIAAAIAVNPREELCAELFRRYDKRVYLWYFSCTHDVDEAIGHARETLEEILWSIGGFAGTARFSTWVYGILRSRCRGEISQLRSKWRARLQAFEGEFVGVLDSGFYDWVDGKCNCERILGGAATGEMTTEELHAFALHYCDGLALKEIAKILGFPNEAAVRTLIQNARRKYVDLSTERASCCCGPDGGAHESVETLAAHLEGRAAGRDPDAVREHIERCPLCSLEIKRLERFIRIESDEELARAAEWIFARGKLEGAFSERVAPILAKKGRKKSQTRRGPSGLLLLVVAAVAAISIVAVSRFSRRGEVDTPPPAPEEARGALSAPYGVRLRAPMGDIRGFPAEFSWWDVRGARYTLEIFSPSLERVYSADGIDAPPFAAPDSLRSILKPNIAYLWRVEGRGELGQAVYSPHAWFAFRR